MAMAKSILTIEEVKQNTGLSLEELEAKVVSLRQESEQLTPISEEIGTRKKELAQLEANRSNLIGKIKELSGQEATLSSSVNSLEVKEVKLLNHVAELEERAHAADKQLSDARRDLKILDKIGMGMQELNRFTVKLNEIVAHHGIKPEDLCHRLLKELKQLDKGLAIEYLVEETEAQLTKLRNETAKEQAEKEGLHNYLNQLISEKTSLEAQVANYRKQLAHDIVNLSSASKETIKEINDNLKSGIKASLSEVNKLSEEATRVGKEVGKMEANIESLSWIKPLLSMVRGENELDDHQVRAIGLSVLRSMLSWLNENHDQDINLYSLIYSIRNTITELEKWKS
jgi:chromosome segregation ATPase